MRQSSAAFALCPQWLRATFNRTLHEPLSGGAKRGGFTLLEVVLALGIALGLLAVVLFFYQQAGRLRDATLTETSRLAAIRLTMDRLATQLRTACPLPGAFSGGPQEIEFVRNGVADPGAWAGSTNGDVEAFPLLRVHYSMVSANAAGGGGGLQCVEEPCDSRTTQPLTNEDNSQQPLTDTNSEMGLDSMLGSNTLLDSPGGTDSLAGLGLGDTNSPDIQGNGNTTAVASLTTSTSTVISELHYFRLRYWNGTAWLNSWTAGNLPGGVEVTLAAEPPATDAGADLSSDTASDAGLDSGSGASDASSDPAEPQFFRRVIALPLAQGSGNSATNQTSGASGSDLEPDVSGQEGGP